MGKSIKGSKDAKSKSVLDKSGKNKSGKNKSAKNKKSLAPKSGATSSQMPKSQAPISKAATSSGPGSKMPPTARSLGPTGQEPVSTPSKGPASAAPSSLGPTSSVSTANKTHLSVQGNQLPTPDQVGKVQGQALSAEELARLQQSGSLPMGINLAMQPTLHKVKSGNEEIMVVMVDAPPCGCRKVNGKKERCRLHRRERRNKKKAKKAKGGMVKDDDSDRNKLGALRHAEDSEEERETPIVGAITPDQICIVGPAGVGLLVPIDTKDNACAGPRAKDMGEPIKGILVKGPQDCPQFIPEDKIPKNAKGEPQFANFQKGTLVKGINGAVFYPDGGNKWDDKGKPVAITGDGIDAELQKQMGDQLHLAGTVDVNETGMPEFRLVDEKHPAPQDKFATLGMMVKVDDQVMFVQSKGQTVGSGDTAPVVPTTKEGAIAAGTVLGDVIIKDGKAEVVQPGQGGGAEVVGTIIQGDFNQPVFVAKTGGPFDKGGVAVDAAAAAANKDPEWKDLAVKDEAKQTAALGAIENSNVFVQASILGKDPAEIRKQLEEAKANTQGAQEVVSVAFGQGYQANRSVFCYNANKAGAAGAGGAGGAGGSNEGGPKFGPGGEVMSYAVGSGAAGGAPRSVFLTPGALPPRSSP